MADETVISVKNLTKVYSLYEQPLDRLKESIHPFRKKYHKDFYALNDVSFDVKKGETVGILGRNGAGKSTLLKILTGVLTATSGSVTVKGKVASLLELGAGFSPEMTGIENIYLNGTIMGFSRDEMFKKIDRIIAFADIGEYVNQPVKTYSSGMFARLAFAVAINVDPDILIIDEALSVGDASFQMKCFNKFKELQNSGVTILFVTHALESIIRFCSTGMVFDKGKKITKSSSKKTVDLFKQILTNSYKPDEKSTKLTQEVKKTFAENLEILDYGNKKAKITRHEILVGDQVSTTIENGIPFEVKMTVLFRDKIVNPIFALTVKDLKGMEITGVNTLQHKIMTGEFNHGDLVDISFKQLANFRPDKYAVSLGCVTYSENGEIEVFNRLYDAIIIEVIGGTEFVGLFDMHSSIRIRRA